MNNNMLINTNVDRMYRLLEKRGRIEFEAIASELEIPLSDVKKWALVLEDGGYASMEYGLTKTYLIWTKQKGAKRIILDEEFVGGARPKTGVSRIHPPKRIAGERKKSGRKERGRKAKIKGKGKGKKRAKSPGKAVAAPKKVGAPRKARTPKKAKAGKRTRKPIGKIGEIKQDAGLKKIEPLKIRKPKVFAGLSSFSAKMKERMDAINAMSDDIAALESEKNELLRNVYDPLEKKFRSELDVISDKLIRNERRVLNLQQRAMSIPEQVEGVEKQFLKIQEIEREAKETFDEANKHIGESLGELSSLQRNAEEKLETARRNIYTESAKLDEMDRTLERIKTIEEEARERIDSTVARMEEESAYIDKVNSALGELGKMKRNLNKGVSVLRENVGTQKVLLRGMEKEMSKIGEVDTLVERYKDDHARKMKELSAYVRDGERDYDTLRETVEANFVGRYMKELSDLASSYDFEIGEAKKMEKSINERIEEKKKALNELLREGREMAVILKERIKKKKKAKPVTVAQVAGKREKLFKALDEKKKERREIVSRISALTKKESERKRAKKGRKKG